MKMENTTTHLHCIPLQEATTKLGQQIQLAHMHWVDSHTGEGISHFFSISVNGKNWVHSFKASAAQKIFENLKHTEVLLMVSKQINHPKPQEA